MAEFSGTKLRVYTKATPAKIDMETDLELSFNSDTKSFRNKDSGNWRELLEGSGELSADLNFNFHVDITSLASNSLEALWDDWVAGNLIDVKIATEETGWLYYTGKFKITDLKITAADQEVVEGSCSMQSSGAVSKSSGSFTPADLGSKLLNWWDGTIVNESGGDVTSWADQKGSIDWAPGTAPAYDAVNDKIDFDSASSEYLQSDANVASVARSSGEYWAVVDFTPGEGQKIIVRSTTSDQGGYFMIDIISDKVRVLGSKVFGGTSPNSFRQETPALTTPGKKIIQFKFTGSAWVCKINNVLQTLTSAGDEANGWESYPITTPSALSINALRRSTGNAFGDTAIKSILRTDGTLTTTEDTSTYNYLNAKY